MARNQAVVVFYDKSGVDKPVTKRLYMKHCNVVKCNDQGELIAYEMDDRELNSRVLNISDPERLFNYWRVISHSVAACLVTLPVNPSTGIYRLKYSSCVQLAKDLLGIQVRAYTPEQLFNKLKTFSVKHERRCNGYI